jgi:hypothetical protein
MVFKVPARAGAGVAPIRPPPRIDKTSAGAAAANGINVYETTMSGSSLLAAWQDRRAELRDARRHFLLRRRFVAGKDLIASLRPALRPRKTILFLPERPAQASVAYQLCALLGFAITTNPRRRFDAAFNLKDATFCDAAAWQDLPASVKRIINVRSLDISKRAMARAFEEVFGYAIAVDPVRHCGRIVEKSNRNAAHDGRELRGPLASGGVRAECVYQKEIDNTSDKNNLVLDHRVPVHGGRIPLVYLKYRPMATRFANANTFVELVEPAAVFSPPELDKLLLLAGKMGVDYGEFDVLRDRKDGRIYVVDINNTPHGPPNGLPESQCGIALERLAKSFELLLENLDQPGSLAVAMPASRPDSRGSIAE